MSTGTERGPSAPLALGVLSGTLAALTILPTAIPLTAQLNEAEQAMALQAASTAANVAANTWERDPVLPPGYGGTLGVAVLSVRRDGLNYHLDGPAIPDLHERTCGTPAGATAFEDWAASCVTKNGTEIVAAVHPPQGSRGRVQLLVLILAVIVGIITALGILQLLSPLHQISVALDQVRAGKRGVRVANPNLRELQTLAERLNATARAMEEREDGFMARIQVVQEMARMVAHEVRNPLQSLEILTTLIASEADEAERKSLAGAIHEEINILNAVVQRLLSEGAATGGIRLKREPQSLEPLIEHLVSVASRDAESRGVKLTVGTVTKRLVPVDGAMLGRSIENLVLNAIQAVPPRTGQVKLSVAEEFPWAAIEVEDNGPGVDPVLGDQIFQANVTTKADGTGLGLALVKGVAEAHGGSVRYDTSLMGGARFVLRIPLDAELDNTDG